MSHFSTQVIRWQRQHGRHDLPWQGTRDPYRIWLAEIMLQQTQVAAVIPYYARFLKKFPTLAALARASEDTVMPYWAGLGYYARARNLAKAAQTVVREHHGVFPHDIEAIEALPGIGRSTAAAIAAFAFGARHAILDGNVKRVLARHFGISGDVKSKAVETDMWALATDLLPRRNIEGYTQGLMDLGATLCTRRAPRCRECPVQKSCVALAEERVAELPTRGKVAATPERSVQMLVMIALGEVLLERRPSSGIWGGLWSFPEVASGTDAARVARTRYGIHGRAGVPLPPLRHGFTHFTLTIAPVTIMLSARPPARPGAVWIALADAVDAAVPAPVKRILRSLSAAPDCD